MKLIYSDRKSISISWLPDVSLSSIKRIICNQATLLQNKKEKSVYSIYDEYGDHPFILKIWTYHGFRYRTKDLFRTGNPYSEYKSIVLLNKLGLACPKLLYFGKDEPNLIDRTYFQITEYIHPGRDALEYVKELLSQNREEDVCAFTDKLISLTQTLLSVGLIDVDHKMINMMVDEDGSPVKIDLELAKIMHGYSNVDKHIGIMVGSFIYSYAFAVQPNVDLAQKFANQMFAVLTISHKAKRVAANVVEQALKTQHINTGISTEIDFQHLLK